MSAPNVASTQPRHTLGQAVALILSWLDEFEETNTPQPTQPAQPSKSKRKQVKK